MPCRLRAEEVDPPPEFRALILMGIIIYLFAVGHWHYRIGESAQIWTESEQRSWRRTGYFSLFILFFAVIGPGLILLLQAIRGAGV